MTDLVGKLCKRCDQDLPSACFYTYPKTGKEHTYCIVCHRANQREYKLRAGRNDQREWAWRNRGISFTVGQFNDLLKQQHGKCAICGRMQSEFSRRLAVDHDHHTGQIRGLLCNLCNTLLGRLDLYKKEIDSYLRQAENCLEESA